LSEKTIEEQTKQKVEEVVEVLDFKALEKARQKLSETMKEIWKSEELQPVRSNLENVGEAMSKPYANAAEESGYAKLLAKEAKRLGLKELMESAWGVVNPK